MVKRVIGAIALVSFGAGVGAYWASYIVAVLIRTGRMQQIIDEWDAERAEA